MAAQMLLNNEILSVLGGIQSPTYVANPVSQGPQSAEGFKAAAVELYSEAAKIMCSQGHYEAAAKFGGVSQALAKDVQTGPAPSEVMTALATDFSNGSKAVAALRRDDAYLAPQPVEAVFAKLEGLTKNQPTVRGRSSAPSIH